MTQQDTAISTCPRWCNSHPHAADGFHQHSISKVWQEYPAGPALSIALESHDEDGPQPRIAVNYSNDGVIDDGSVSLSLSQAEEYLLTLQRIIAHARTGA